MGKVGRLVRYPVKEMCTLTLVLAYRFGDKAVILNDFRVSYDQERQVDAMMKFAHFDNRIGLHLAGDVAMWQSIIPVISSIESEVTLSSVLDPEGPLRATLRQYLEQNTTNAAFGTRIGAIGFILNETTKKNVVFKFEGGAGQGCIIDDIPDDTCVVIGTGYCIPKIESIVQLEAKKALQSKVHIHDIASSMLRELEKTLEKCGGSVYQRLGISPFFAKSALVGSSFEMIGEEVEWARYTVSAES